MVDGKQRAFLRLIFTLNWSKLLLFVSYHHHHYHNQNFVKITQFFRLSRFEYLIHDKPSPKMSLLRFLLLLMRSCTELFPNFVGEKPLICLILDNATIANIGSYGRFLDWFNWRIEDGRSSGNLDRSPVTFLLRIISFKWSLALSWRRSLSYRNQHIGLPRKFFSFIYFFSKSSILGVCQGS